MSTAVDLKYLLQISSEFPIFKIASTNPYKINVRCPLCGDSQKSKHKARGWFLENNNSLFYYCHNCSESKPFGKFLKETNSALYNSYYTETFVSGGKREQVSLALPELKKKIYPNIEGLKKISSLPLTHPARAYVESRKIPSNQHYRIFYVAKFASWVNKFLPGKLDPAFDEPRLLFPFFSATGELYGVSARSFSAKGLRYITIMFDEKQTKLFGKDKINFTKPYKVVEGAIDSLFLENSVAMAGADANLSGLQNIENATFIFDNEPRNAEIVARMKKVISKGLSLCIWPSEIKVKDINEMVLAGLSPTIIIEQNTFSGLAAPLRLAAWRKA